MDRLRAIADAHYRAGPPAVKALAYDFFRALDANLDGKVSLHEFLTFMRNEGYTKLSNPHLFRELDKDGNGTLDFWDVLTLYYIIKSGRPLCDCCGVLIPGTFFSCVECFDVGSYDLCIHCYRSNMSAHNHDGRQQFLDTFTLLETKKKRSGLGRRPIPMNGSSTWQSSRPTMGPTQATHTHLQSNAPQPPNWGTPQEPNAIVPADHRINRWKATLMALEMALSVGTIATTLCTIL